MFHKLSYLSRLLLEVKLGNIRKRGYGGRWAAAAAAELPQPLELEFSLVGSLLKKM